MRAISLPISTKGSFDRLNPALHDKVLAPELMASVLARYSRSDAGLENILLGIKDWDNTDAAIDSVLKFIDYGHASIGGLVGGIGIALDGISMWLAYKIFEIAQMSDGQESSTRYIIQNELGISDPNLFGLAPKFHDEWRDLVKQSYALYNREKSRLDAAVTQNPALARIPADAKESVQKRMINNYGLDRARGFLPFVGRTNMGLIQSARMWAQTIRDLESIPITEAKQAAGLIRDELKKNAPRVLRHSYTKPEIEALTRAQYDLWIRGMKEHPAIADSVPDEVYLKVSDSAAPFVKRVSLSHDESLKYHTNRYMPIGSSVARMSVYMAFNNISIAEWRDLNRHRTGHRIGHLAPVGSYLAPEIPRTPEIIDWDKKWLDLRQRILASDDPYAYVTTLRLCDQIPAEHTQQADKFLYEGELRTGMGAHLRYAHHMAMALRQFHLQVPVSTKYVQVGTAEPE